MSIYLDASIVIALLGAEHGSDAARAYIDAVDEPLMLSDFARGEVASAVSRLVRMKKIDAQAATDRLDAFDEWAMAATRLVATKSSDIGLAILLVRRFALELRMHDAIHLAASQIRGLTLATLDRKLAIAAEDLQIPFMVPA